MRLEEFRCQELAAAATSIKGLITSFSMYFTRLPSHETISSRFLGVWLSKGSSYEDGTGVEIQLRGWGEIKWCVVIWQNNDVLFSPQPEYIISLDHIIHKEPQDE